MKKFALALALFALPACPKPTPGGDASFGTKVADCGLESVRKCTGDVLPVVLGCLDSKVDVKACLIGVGSSGVGCLAFDTIACVTRAQRDLVPLKAMMANGPTADQLRRSARAAEFIEKTGVVFDDGR